MDECVIHWGEDEIGLLLAFFPGFEGEDFVEIFGGHFFLVFLIGSIGDWEVLVEGIDNGEEGGDCLGDGKVLAG